MLKKLRELKKNGRKSIRLRKNIRQFKRKRVDVSKYIKDFYVENGLAYISCNVSEYTDIIDRYSVKGYEWLEESFTRFIESNAAYVPTEYPIVLEICGHRFSDEEKSTIEATIADYYALKMGDCQLILEQNTRKCITLLLFSVLFVLIVLKAGGIPGVNRAFSEVYLVFFGFFLWELADCAWFDRRILINARTDAAQMASIKVVFKPVFVDSPVADEEVVLEEIFEDTEILPSDYTETDYSDNIPE